MCSMVAYGFVLTHPKKDDKLQLNESVSIKV